MYRDRVRLLEHHEAPLAVALDTGTRLVDPVPVLAAHREEFLFMDTIGHFTRRRHALVAELLRGVLVP